MLTFPFGTDAKFTVIPMMGGTPIAREDMVDIQVRVETWNRVRSSSFEPVWGWNAVGVEIEIEHDKIKTATTYYVTLSWRRPDNSFNDGYKDIRGVRACIAFVEGWCAGQCEQDGQVIELVVSPEFKGEKGDPFRFEDFTPEQLDDLQRPAIEAAETANQAATIAITAAGKADTATQSAITATSAANQAAENANTAAAAADNATTGVQQAIQDSEAATTKAIEATGKAILAAENADNAAQGIDNKIEVKFSNETERMKILTFAELWNASAGRFGKYNTGTGFFELNGITDITFAQAVKIYTLTANMYGPNIDLRNTRDYESDMANIRTNLPAIYFGYPSTVVTFTTYISGIEILNLRPFSMFGHTSVKINQFNASMLYFSGKLREVHGILNLIDATGYQTATNYALPMLTTLYLMNIKFSLAILAQAPLISLESLTFLVENAANTTAITITLHPDAYARLTSELVEAALLKNIQFVTI